MEIKDRIKLFLEEKGISQRKFEISIEKSNGYVNNIVKTITVDVLAKIINTYPELNITWLITGEGDMLKEYKNIEGELSEEPNTMNETLNSTYFKSEADMIREIERQRTTIDNLNRMINSLIEENESLKRELSLRDQKKDA